MERLGLGYDAVRAINPGIVYCSITGYGQTGPKASAAGHGLNYAGDAGVLSLRRGPEAQPTTPFGLVADIGVGTYPAVASILRALMARQKSGEGAHLDIGMSEGALAYWAHAARVIAGQEIGSATSRLAGAALRAIGFIWLRTGGRSRSVRWKRNSGKPSAMSLASLRVFATAEAVPLPVPQRLRAVWDASHRRIGSHC